MTTHSLGWQEGSASKLDMEEEEEEVEKQDPDSDGEDPAETEVRCEGWVEIWCVGDDGGGVKGRELNWSTWLMKAGGAW